MSIKGSEDPTNLLLTKKLLIENDSIESPADVINNIILIDEKYEKQNQIPIEGNNGDGGNDDSKWWDCEYLLPGCEGR